MKFPAFWSVAAEVWFAQADAQLSIHSITVLKLSFFLPQEVASQILDLIRAPPPGDPYEVLRE